MMDPELIKAIDAAVDSWQLDPVLVANIKESVIVLRTAHSAVRGGADIEPEVARSILGLFDAIEHENIEGAVGNAIVVAQHVLSMDEPEPGVEAGSPVLTVAITVMGAWLAANAGVELRQGSFKG